MCNKKPATKPYKTSHLTAGKARMELKLLVGIIANQVEALIGDSWSDT